LSTGRVAALAGIGYVVLAVVLGVLEGSPPAPSASEAEVTAYIAGNRAGSGVGLWLFGLAAVALLWWFGELWARMATAENGMPRLAIVSATGLVLGGTMSFASAVLLATLALVDQPESVVTLNAIAALFVTTAGFGLGAHLIATSVLAARSKMFGNWLVGLGFASAVGFLAAGVLGAVLDDEVPNLVSLTGFGLWLVWIVGVSVRMLRDDEPSPLNARSTSEDQQSGRHESAGQRRHLATTSDSPHP
jgi:hypothetical protein